MTNENHFQEPFFNLFTFRDWLWQHVTHSRTKITIYSILYYCNFYYNPLLYMVNVAPYPFILSQSPQRNMKKQRFKNMVAINAPHNDLHQILVAIRATTKQLLFFLLQKNAAVGCSSYCKIQRKIKIKLKKLVSARNPPNHSIYR